MWLGRAEVECWSVAVPGLGFSGGNEAQEAQLMGRACRYHDIPQFDCVDCKAVASVRQAVADGRVELAPTVLVDMLEPYVEQVLEALEHSEALVTDLSKVGDFSLEDEERAAASARLGVVMTDTDYIYEVAQRVRDKT